MLWLGSKRTADGSKTVGIEPSGSILASGLPRMGRCVDTVVERSIQTPKPKATMSKKPKMDETYACQQCGMTIKVLVACECDDDKCPKMECCGQPLSRTD